MLNRKVCMSTRSMHKLYNLRYVGPHRFFRDRELHMQRVSPTHSRHVDTGFDVFRDHAQAYSVHYADEYYTVSSPSVVYPGSEPVSPQQVFSSMLACNVPERSVTDTEFYAKEIMFYPDHWVDDGYHSVEMLTQLPVSVPRLALHTLQEVGNVTMHVTPLSASYISLLNHDALAVWSDMQALLRQNKMVESLKVKHDHITKMIQTLQHGGDSAVQVSVYFHLKADTLNELQQKRSELRARSGLLTFTTPTYRMRDAYVTVHPFGEDKLAQRHTLLRSTLPALYPFTRTVAGTGVTLGSINRDPWQYHNANGLVLGASGSGKTFFVQQYVKQVKYCVLDPEGEYAGYKVHIVNPLHVHDRYETAMAESLDMLSVMLDLSEPQRSIMNKCLGTVYAVCGWYSGTKGERHPTLSDLYKELVRRRKPTRGVHRSSYDAICNRLEPFLTGNAYGMFDGCMVVPDHNLAIDLSHVPDSVKAYAMRCIIEHVRWQRDVTIVVDEAWMLITQFPAFTLRLVKTCRKRGVQLILVTQDVTDVTPSILANVSWCALFHVPDRVSRDVQRTFSLSDSEREFLERAPRGHALYLPDHCEFTVTGEQHTTTEEVLTPVQASTLDLDTDVHAVDGLSDADHKLLRLSGYHRARFDKEYYVRPAWPEGVEHTYYVHVISERLRETEDVTVHRTVMPDIMTPTKVVEVETGIGKRYSVKRVKFELVKKRWPHCVIVCTRDDVEWYKQFGLPVYSVKGYCQIIQ